MEVRVLAVASGGGHWEQLMLLRPMLERFDVSYATTDAGMAERDGLPGAHIMEDCNRDHWLATLRAGRDAQRIVSAVRPDVVVTTGALPGLLCLAAGRARGARTIWIDSVANCERISGSGRFARFVAGRCYTQWEHLAGAETRFRYAGSLL